MRSSAAVHILCVLLGIIIINEVQQVSSLLPRTIQRRTEQRNTTTQQQEQQQEQQLQQDIQRLLSLLLPVSEQHGEEEEDFSLETFFSVLSQLFSVVQSLLSDGFAERLPEILVCLLSGRQDCGPQAQLTEKLGKPLLTLLTSLRSQACFHGDAEPTSPPPIFLRAFGGVGEKVTTAFSGLQQTVVNILSHVTLTGEFTAAAGGLVDAAVANALEFSAMLLRTPVEYIKVALQFGIRVPSLDEEETCQQGDLKQLIMWGINNDIRWSFGFSILDILLDVFFTPLQPPCAYPDQDCPDPHGVYFRRRASDAGERRSSLECDRRDLAQLNDTLCAGILWGSGAGFPASLRNLCRALSSLSEAQIERVWSNVCSGLVRPLAGRSSDCGVWAAPLVAPPPAVAPTPAVAPPPAVPGSAPRRAARAADNLQLLACNYDGWSQGEAEAVLVNLCADNDHEEFVRRVCDDGALMKTLLTDPANAWLYGHCANFSARPQNLVTLFCDYGQWLARPDVRVGAPLLGFCMSLDGPALTKHICQHNGFFTLLFSHTENIPFMVNCSTLQLPVGPLPVGADPLVPDSCRYSEWRDVPQTSPEVLVECNRLDPVRFNVEVCGNATFLGSLLLNPMHGWLQGHCETSVAFLPTQPPSPPRNITDWCDYHTWERRLVDESVVGLCWREDQAAFEKKVCCEPAVLDNLLENPQNQWLTTVCRDKGDVMSPQACQYSEWIHPIMVDMTEVALCTENDPLNFTSQVCANRTILQNLLTNQDNVWLIKHCANHTDPGGGGGGEGAGFGIEQCQYRAWSVALPDVSVLTLCWEHDQTRFVSSVCPNAPLLLLLSQQPSSAWVNGMCATYANLTTPGPTTSTGTSTGTSTTAAPDPCLARKLVRKFYRNCSADFTEACRPGASQGAALHMMLRCWAEGLKSRMEDRLTGPAAAVLEQAVSTAVVFLLAMEEIQNTSLHVVKNIRVKVIESVGRYLEREEEFERKRVLLQCFGTVITSLMSTTRDLIPDEFFFIKEYFRIPLSSLRSVLRGADLTTVRLILQFYDRNKETLQLPDQYLSTMVSELVHTHVEQDITLFPELVSLLAAASPADIQGLPAMQNEPVVMEVINRNLQHLSLEQREAFGLWFSQEMTPSQIAKGHQSLIRDTGNLIAYLPFRNFRHLSPAQLVDGLDVLRNNNLTSLKQDFIAQALISPNRNLTAQDFIRLGELLCLANPAVLLLYRDSEAFTVIQRSVMNCTREGLSLPNHLISSLLLDSAEFRSPSSLSAERLAEVAHLTPLLGVTFLQGLTPWQVVNALPTLSAASYSPEQASVIVDKLTSVIPMTAPRQLQELGSLIVGMKIETLLTLTSDMLLSSLPAMAQHPAGLSPSVANFISTKLWGFPEVVNWTNEVEPLLYCTPLISFLPRTPALINNIDNIKTKPLNTQQAIAMFRQGLDAGLHQFHVEFLSLGSLGQGLTCKFLEERFRTDSSPPAVRRLLLFLRQQPGPLHTYLKKCVIEELLQLEFFSQLLIDLGAEIALSIPMSKISKLSSADMDTLRLSVLQDPHQFRLQPRKKQELLVTKLAQKLEMYTGVFTEEEFRSLGVMAPFVEDEVFIHVDRSFFIDNLDYLLGLCYSPSKMKLMARILEEPAVFGPTATWTQVTVSQVDRFIFFLPREALLQIPMGIITVGHLEKLFMIQHRWEQGDEGRYCLTPSERTDFFNKQQFVLQFFLGFLKMTPVSAPPMVPTCEVLHTIPPATWTPSALTSMTPSHFSNCLELIGQDQFLLYYQRRPLLQRVKQTHGPVASFPQSVASQLGVLALELTLEELSRLPLTEQRSIAALGAVSEWNNTQLVALFRSVLNSTKRIPSQLESSTLVAMGNIVCGASVSEIQSFNAVELSKAALYLGRLNLSCSEEQMDALVDLLTHSLAFGIISSWGTDVFIEIGVLAAGFQDFVLSSLVREQIMGISPMAISRTSVMRLRVAVSHTQISMFSYEQAAAVTQEQLDALTEVQRKALDMVLTPWENRPVDFRGKSLGLALSHNPVCLILGLLILRITLPCPPLT